MPAEYATLFENLKFIGNAQKGYGVWLSRGAPNDVQESLREWYQYTQNFLTDKVSIDDWAAKHKSNVAKYLNESMKVWKVNPRFKTIGNIIQCSHVSKFKILAV